MRIVSLTMIFLLIQVLSSSVVFAGEGPFETVFNKFYLEQLLSFGPKWIMKTESKGNNNLKAVEMRNDIESGKWRAKNKLKKENKNEDMPKLKRKKSTLKTTEKNKLETTQVNNNHFVDAETGSSKKEKTKRRKGHGREHLKLPRTPK